MVSELNPSDVINYSSQEVSYPGSNYGIANPTINLGGYSSGLGVAINSAVITFALNIDDSKEVTEAYLNLIQASSTGQLEIQIAAEDADDGSVPSSASDALSRSLTTPIIWNLDSDSGVGRLYSSPDISSIINELILRGGWTSGNNLNIYITVVEPTITGSSLTSTRKKQFEHDSVTLEITYDERIDAGDGIRTVHELTFEQIIGADAGYIYADDHIIEFEQLILVQKVYNRSTTSIVLIDHTPYIKSDPNEVVDGIFFEQDIAFNTTRTYAVEHTLIISQDILRNTEFDKNVHSYLTPENNVVDYVYAIIMNLEHTLIIDSVPVANNKNFEIEDAVDIVQEFTYEIVIGGYKNITSIITITQDIDFTINRVKSVEHTLVLEHGTIVTGGLIEGDCSESLRYAPRGSNSFPPFTPISVQNDIVLTNIDTSATLTLPRPLFSDREELEVPRINRRTLGGDLKVYSDPLWQSVRVFRYKFEGLSDTARSDVFTFLSNSLGLPVELRDHENRTYEGYIVNPQGESGQFFRQCGDTTEFDFEVA